MFNNKNSFSKYMIKVDRAAAWVLLVVIVLYGVTGYGMTKGLIDKQFSNFLHLSLLGVIGLVSFVIHTAWAAHLALRRHNFWNRFSKIGLVGCYILLVLFFGWVHFFYQNQNVVKSSNLPAYTNEDSAAMVYTAATLAPYNGLNGQPAYVAIDGVVYNMSRVFRNGTHYGYGAGKDLSVAFHSEHPNNYLQGYPVVGSYK